ncbi:MAG: sel1 repeat family protein [Flavobacteriaceae bacterium]|nr:sel1 repeat family protein [Flavobacteriaceae bacterium]
MKFLPPKTRNIIYLYLLILVCISCGKNSKESFKEIVEKAKQGNAEAQYRLGLIYYNSEEVSTKINKEYLLNLFNELGGEKELEGTFDEWSNAIKDNEEYKLGLFNELGGEKELGGTFDEWNSNVFGVIQPNKEYLLDIYNAVGREKVVEAKFDEWVEYMKTDKDYRKDIFNELGGEEKFGEKFEEWDKTVFGVVKPNDYTKKIYNYLSKQSDVQMVDENVFYKKLDDKEYAKKIYNYLSKKQDVQMVDEDLFLNKIYNTDNHQKQEEEYEYKGETYTLSQLKETYGDRVDEAINKFGFKKIEKTLETNEDIFGVVQPNDFTKKENIKPNNYNKKIYNYLYNKKLVTVSEKEFLDGLDNDEYAQKIYNHLSQQKLVTVNAQSFYKALGKKNIISEEEIKDEIKQQNSYIKRHKLYNFLKENNLTKKDFKSFSKTHKNNSEQLYKFLKDNNLTNKDYNSFHTDYFGYLKIEEELTLSEKDRTKLDNIVQKMIKNNENDDNILFAINDFKKKYSKFKNNIQKAFYWFKKSAEQDNANAQYYLGKMYYKGEGTPKDTKKAFRWFKKSAEQGNSNAQYDLALMYKNGEETLTDKKQALHWLKKSAEQGLDKGQYNLGVIYYYGEGTSINKKQSAYWIRKSYENGNEKAKKFWEDHSLWRSE